MSQYLNLDAYEDARPVLDLLRSRLAEPWTTAGIARAARLSERTLYRRFKETTGESPTEWLIRERIAAACELLERTRLPVETIAFEVGFGAVESFRQHFRRLKTIAPRRYRLMFATAPGDRLTSRQRQEWM